MRKEITEVLLSIKRAIQLSLFCCHPGVGGEEGEISAIYAFLDCFTADLF